MGRNKQRLSLQNGAAYADGLKIMDCISCAITFKPNVSESRVIGSSGTDRRWLSSDINVAITEYKSTPWLKELVKKYKSTGKTPELTIQGVQNDKGSDYNSDYGDEVITAVGCVITSDINLIELDVTGEHVKSSITLGAKDVVI